MKKKQKRVKTSDLSLKKAPENVSRCKIFYPGLFKISKNPMILIETNGYNYFCHAQ